MSKELPPAFGLNIGKGEDIQLLYRVRKENTYCRFYQSTDSSNCLMMYDNNDENWVIKKDTIEDCKSDKRENDNCENMIHRVNNQPRFKILYTLPKVEIRKERKCSDF